MSLFARQESTVGPLAVDGRTVTLVARATALRMGGATTGNVRIVRVKARPVHIEVLDDSGQREIMRIRDVEQTIVRAVTAAGLIGAVVVRIVRRNQGRPAR